MLNPTHTFTQLIHWTHLYVEPNHMLTQLSYDDPTHMLSPLTCWLHSYVDPTHTITPKRMAGWLDKIVGWSKYYPSPVLLNFTVLASTDSKAPSHGPGAWNNKPFLRHTNLLKEENRKFSGNLAEALLLHPQKANNIHSTWYVKTVINRKPASICNWL